MNWRRGIFRIWVVGSAFWCAAVAAFAFTHQPAKTVTFMYQQQTRLQFPADVDPDEAKKAITEFIKEQRAKVKDPYDKYGATPEAEAAQIVGAYQPVHLSDHVVGSLAIAAIPPAVIFGLGLVVMWIGKGFRSSSPTTERNEA